MCSPDVVVAPVPPPKRSETTTTLSKVWTMMHEKGSSSSSSSFASWSSLFLVALICASSLRFSSWLPFVIPLGVAPAAIETYIPAGYLYDIENTHFDNTMWTYGTDYVLTIVMSIIACMCYAADADVASRRLRMYASALLVCYASSTLAGGWAHQHYEGVGMLNTTKFRMLWTVTVGNVAFASCYMGLIGREVQRAFGVDGGAVPLGPWWFWPVYGAYMAAACGLGRMSYKRPACDIFIAGITQFPTTAYCVVALASGSSRRWPTRHSTASSSSSSCDNPTAASSSSSSSSSPIDLVRLPYRIMYYAGFVGNSPLLPMYPLLVQYSGMSLGAINTLLHAWLMTMWGMQGISLLHLIKAIGSESKVSKKC